MHNRIHLLSPLLINQIAAGEVIERPASVLKELLENSIDARSTTIEIFLEGGGIQWLCVQDNGNGIYKEDLSLAISQHATSKISAMHDLEGIASLGFRGEALASIGSVSRLRVCSKPKDQEKGWEITTEGREEVVSVIPSNCTDGTRVEMHDLFYNTPARRRFLSSEKTELRHIEEMFRRIALSHFNVSFSMHSQKKEKRYPACVTSEMKIRRVRELCGKVFSERALYVESATESMKLWGWVDVNQEVPRSDVHLFFVNGRFIRDKVMLHAIKQACLDQGVLIDKGPSYLLYLEVDPKMVDVNVHPTKSEVRFREARLVHAFLWHNIKEVLEKFREKPSSLENLDALISEDFFETTSLASDTHTRKEIPTMSSNEGFILDNRLLFVKGKQQIQIADLPKIKHYFTKLRLGEAVAGRAMDPQLLVIPKRIKMDKKTVDLDKLKPLLEHFGFIIDQVGLNEVLVRAVSKLLRFENIEHSIKRLLQELFSMKTLEQGREKIVSLILDEVMLQSSFSIEEAVGLLNKIEKLPLEVQSILLKEKIYNQFTMHELMSTLF